MEPSYDDLGRNPFGDSSQQFDFFPTSMHRQVVMRIARGLESRCGLVLLTGEIGIGKTTLCRHIQQQFSEPFAFAELGNPYLSPAEQLFHFCQIFGVPLSTGSGAKDQMDALQGHLLELHQAGKSPVIIIDESHLLTRAHFGQLLVLSNLRFEAAPLVQILLVGQLELMDRLREMGLEALNQRIGVRCELRPLNLQETAAYIRFKLESAGLPKPDLFTDKAVERIWKVSGGLPRLVNHVCAHVFDQLAFSGRESVGPDMVDEVSRDGMYQELFTTRTRKAPAWRKALPAATVLAAAVAVAAMAFGPGIWPGTTDRTGERAGGPEQVRVETGETDATAAPQAPAPAARPEPVAVVATVEPAPEPVPEPAAPEPKPAPKPEPKPAPEPAPEPKPEPAPAPIADSKTIEPARPAAEASPVPANASQTTADDGKDNSHKDDLPFITDGSNHPVVGRIAIDAVAWSDRSPERIVVLNEKVMREGDNLGTVRLDMIGREYLLFSYQGELYKRRWHQ